MTLEQDVILVNFPDKGKLKVIQLFLDNKPIMVCGPRYTYHRHILREYLISQNIEPSETVIYGKTLPAIEGKRYKVVGMGHSAVDKEKKYFEVPNNMSIDYFLSPNKDFNERLKQQFKGWDLI